MLPGPKQPITVMWRLHESATNSACGLPGPYSERAAAGTNAQQQPKTHVMMAPKMHPKMAALLLLAAKMRAWKSGAVTQPMPRTKMVAQLKTMALGMGSYASGSLIPSKNMGLSPRG
jgi:hypothetical protein